MPGKMVYICSWHPGGPKVFRVVEDPRVPEGEERESHGLCPECATRINKELDEEEAKKRRKT